jgi:hypothetical protein
MVWMKVKEDTTEDQMKNWIESAKMLRDIPGVLKVEAGKFHREFRDQFIKILLLINDSNLHNLICSGRNFTTRTDHQLGLLVFLKDKEALSNYATHPIHLKFIEVAANDIKVVANAFDFINESI